MTLLNSIIKLAYKNPSMRPTLLPIIKEAMEFDTKGALEKYLKEHPDADKSKHTVKKTDDKKEESEKKEVGDQETAKVGDGGVAKAGFAGTAIAGNQGKATAGNQGKAQVGDGGTATAGNQGTAIAGKNGTAIVGKEGKAKAGEGGTIQFGRIAIKIGHIYGADNDPRKGVYVEPDTFYRIKSNGDIEKA